MNGEMVSVWPVIEDTEERMGDYERASIRRRFHLVPPAVDDRIPPPCSSTAPYPLPCSATPCAFPR